MSSLLLSPEEDCERRSLGREPSAFQCTPGAGGAQAAPDGLPGSGRAAPPHPELQQAEVPGPRGQAPLVRKPQPHKIGSTQDWASSTVGQRREPRAPCVTQTWVQTPASHVLAMCPGPRPSGSRWGPQKRGLLGLAALPFSAGGGRKRAAWRHGLQFPGPRLTPEVGKQPGSQLGAAGRASFQAATQRKPFVHLTWKADHSRWGRGSSGKTLCVEVPFGCSGAGRSCPFSTHCSAICPQNQQSLRKPVRYLP